MKILVVSDTHKHHENLEKVLSKIGKIDCMIHLGDAEGYEDYIASIANCPLYIVAGNNDWFSNLDKEMTIMLGKYNVFLTHGHYYYVSLGIENLIEEGRAKEKDVVMFGHTHVPMIKQFDDITILNPGSISYPRQDNHKPSYIVMEIDRKGEAHYTLNYL